MLTSGYCVTAELRVKDETKVEETVRALAALCVVTRKEPGCQFFVLHKDLTDPRRLLLWECFDNQAALTKHFEYSHTKAYFALGLTEVVQHFKTMPVG